MVNLKPQFSGLLSSITLALVVVDALPQNERKPREPASPVAVNMAVPDIQARAPLMRRGIGSSGSSRAKMMRQREAAALFEASRLAQAHARREREEQDSRQKLSTGSRSFADSPGEPITRPTEAKRDHYHHHHHHHGDHWRDGGDGVIITGDNNHIHAHSHKRHDNYDRLRLHEQLAVEGNSEAISGDDEVDPPVKRHNHGQHHHHPNRPDHHHDTAMVADGPFVISGNNNHVHSHSHKRHHHHHYHRPDDTSKGGHSDHWYEHHKLDPDHPHHHHHHHRIPRARPNRLARSGSEDAFIAPASARVGAGKASGQRKGMKVSGSVAGSKMVKKPKKKGEGQANADWSDREDKDKGDYEEGNGHGREKQTDRPEHFNKRSFPVNPPSTNPATHPLALASNVLRGTPGVLELIANHDGTKLGGLSLSPVPDASNTTAHTTLAYHIDSTPNPAEQTTFYLHRFTDQTLLRAEPPMNPATQAVQDLLVSLQVPTQSLERMCATFNPVSQDAQVFGLALCMDSSGATGSKTASGSTSQAFRYSPGTGVVRPFYGIGGAGEKVLAEQVNARVEQVEGLGSSSNVTETVAPGSTPPSLLALDPLEQSRTYVNETADPAWDCTESTCSTARMTRPVLAVQVKSVMDDTPPSQSHALIIGDDEFLSESVANVMSQSENSTGALMVFRTVYLAPTEDNDTENAPREQRIRRDMDEMAMVDSAGSGTDGFKVVDLGEIETLGRDAPLGVGSSQEDDHGYELSGIRARAVGSTLQYAGLGDGEVEPVRGGVMTHTDDTEPITSYPASARPPSVSPYRSPNSPTNPNTSSRPSTLDLDDLEPSPLHDKPLPKPVINVAYFGDSGRSAPVPPEDQAETAHPILLADPGKKLGSSAPVALATTGEGMKDGHGGIVGVYLVPPKAKASKMTVMSVGGESRSVEGSEGCMPLDASD